MKLLLLLAGIAVVYWAYRRAARYCRRVPQVRPWLILASLAALAGAVAIVPWATRLKPPWSESPSGIFLLLARFIPISLVCLSAIGAILGAILPERSTPEDQ